jgi:transposase-like protein
MKKRQWTSKIKAKIVLEGLSGKPVSEICSQHQISQTQYYQWRDKFLTESYRAFETKEAGGEVVRLKQKTAKLQQIIGALTVELKKTEDELL